MAPRGAVNVFYLRHHNSLLNFRFKIPPEQLILPEACQCSAPEEAVSALLCLVHSQLPRSACPGVSLSPTAIVITLMFSGQIFLDLQKSLMAEFWSMLGLEWRGTI